ncbi:MAG: hypothetical protein EAZ53_08620 [Bacteroidetes bacterium]|nr:MAG: hypothetical protein EAZ53_08620 [Bacteroidota bacterium]
MSCGSALDNDYSKATAEGDLERIKAIGELDSANFDLLTDYMLKQGLIEPDLKHLDESYAELLEHAKRENEKVIKKKEASDKLKGNKNQFQMDQLEHLYEALVILPDQSNIRKDWSNKNAVFYKMVFVNPSEKSIRAFKGKLSFYDLFDSELKTVNFTYNDLIAAKDTILYEANIDFSSLNNNNVYFTKDYSDIRVIWRPLKVIYNDGSEVE